jgi:hypothetical protein
MGKPLAKEREAAPDGKRSMAATGAEKKKNKVVVGRGSKPKDGHVVSIVDVEVAPLPAEEEQQSPIVPPTAYNMLGDMSRG